MQLLIFDLGNVVCRIDFQRVLRAWAGGDETVVARLAPLFTHDEAYERHERGELSIEAYKDHVCARLGLFLSLEEFVHGWNAVFIGEMEGIRDVLASFRGRVPLVLLSNTNATHAAWFRQHLADLLAPFDRLFLSHEVGMRKPEARFFEHVLAECGVRADQALFFDDLAENLCGAEAVGIPSVLVRGVEDIRAALSPEIETLDSRVVYQNRWMTVREDRIRRRNGAEGLYGVVEKPDFAILLPLLGDSIVLVEQYRYTVGQRCWELPAGAYEDAVLDKETLALKELQEETGYSASELVPVGELFTANGYSTQRCHVFIAKGLRPGTPSLEEEEQGLIAKAFPLAEFERMVTSGQIRDAATVSAFGLARLKGLL